MRFITRERKRERVNGPVLRDEFVGLKAELARLSLLFQHTARNLLFWDKHTDTYAKSAPTSSDDQIYVHDCHEINLRRQHLRARGGVQDYFQNGADRS